MNNAPHNLGTTIIGLREQLKLVTEEASSPWIQKTN